MRAVKRPTPACEAGAGGTGKEGNYRTKYSAKPAELIDMIDLRDPEARRRTFEMYFASEDLAARAYEWDHPGFAFLLDVGGRNVLAFAGERWVEMALQRAMPAMGTVQ